MNDVEQKTESVLVVDDTQENIDVLLGILGGCYTIKVATSGRLALKIAFSAKPPDLILLDVMMPEMDGYEVCRQLKADERTRNIPIIFLTSKTEVAEEAHGFSLGAEDYIAKPVSAPVVLARVKTHLELYDRSRHLEGLVQERTASLKLAEEQLMLSAKVFESGGECIIITDADERILMANRAFTTVTGYSQEDVIGQTPRMMSSGRHDADFFNKMWQTLRDTGHWQGEIWDRRKNGEIYPEWLSISVVKDATGQIVNYIGLFSDITERKAAEAQIEFLAYHDALTELPNRRLAIDRMGLAFAFADRDETKAAILLLDLDNFKAINDSFGHSIGDRLLKEVTESLRMCVRDTDTISRHGGDEFLILLANVSDNDAITGVTEKILEQLENTFLIEGKEISTSLSIGIAVYPDDSKDIDTLLKFADTAMFHAKEAGKNTYQFYSEQMNIDAVEHQRIRIGLRRAVERNEFVLYYQPQIDLSSGVVIGAEALIRWNHPELGLTQPGRFIPTAEESGLIVPMGDWALREACRQAAAWRKAGLPELVVAVNISTMQFKRGNLEQSVCEALAESGLPATCLELELTESILIQNPEKVLETVRRLKSLGIMFSIDDFGTGYSSLSYLKRFSVDKLKIDQSFVRDMINDPNDAVIVRAIIQMARSLNLKTIAEGVENEHLASFLRLQYCDEAQGYHFARPLPPDEFAQYLANSPRVIT
jgi:diguanylate cyclase (GGDEF)-like protein/PAS domain S-box-containing protein